MYLELYLKGCLRRLKIIRSRSLPEEFLDVIFSKKKKKKKTTKFVDRRNNNYMTSILEII